MSTSTSTTGRATATGSTVRPGLCVGEQVVAVQFGVWGPQEVAVRAYSGGGRGGAPYVAVSVGTCLTYAYDQAAIESWPGLGGRRAHERHRAPAGVPPDQRHTVTGSTGADGRPALTVTVGAVTVVVHTTTALRSYLAAWRKAAALTAMLEDAHHSQ